MAAAARCIVSLGAKGPERTWNTPGSKPVGATPALAHVAPGWREKTMVETMGLEPTTPCLQSRCSSQLSYAPETGR